MYQKAGSKTEIVEPTEIKMLPAVKYVSRFGFLSIDIRHLNTSILLLPLFKKCS